MKLTPEPRGINSRAEVCTQGKSANFWQNPFFSFNSLANKWEEKIMLQSIEKKTGFVFTETQIERGCMVQNVLFIDAES